MNVEIGTEAAQFLLWEYLMQIFGMLSLQCSSWQLQHASLSFSNFVRQHAFCIHGILLAASACFLYRPASCNSSSWQLQHALLSFCYFFRYFGSHNCITAGYLSHPF
jgi:hypothetical protein